MFLLSTLSMSNILNLFFRLTKVIRNVYKLTNFTVIHLDFTDSSAGATCQNQIELDKQILSHMYVCLLPSEVSLQLKNLPKTFTKTTAVKVKLIEFSKAHACLLQRLYYSSNSPCLFTKNA